MRAAALVLLALALCGAAAWAAETTVSALKIDIGKMTCKELMGGNDLDREVGIAYFHGFLAGKTNSQVVDVKATSERTDKVKDYCLSNPASTVMDAFTKAGK